MTWEIAGEHQKVGHLVGPDLQRKSQSSLVSQWSFSLIWGISKWLGFFGLERNSWCSMWKRSAKHWCRASVTREWLLMVSHSMGARENERVCGDRHEEVLVLCMEIRTHHCWSLWSWSFSFSKETNDWKINPSRMSDCWGVPSALDILEMQEAERDYCAGTAGCLPALTLLYRCLPLACQSGWWVGRTFCLTMDIFIHLF